MRLKSTKCIENVLVKSIKKLQNLTSRLNWQICWKHSHPASLKSVMKVSTVLCINSHTYVVFGFRIPPIQLLHFNFEKLLGVPSGFLTYHGTIRVIGSFFFFEIMLEIGYALACRDGHIQYRVYCKHDCQLEKNRTNC